MLNQIAGVEISQKDAIPSVFVIGNKSRAMMVVALNPHLQAQTNCSTGKCLTPKQNNKTGAGTQRVLPVTVHFSICFHNPICLGGETLSLSA